MRDVLRDVLRMKVHPMYISVLHLRLVGDYLTEVWQFTTVRLFSRPFRLPVFPSFERGPESRSGVEAHNGSCPFRAKE